MSEGVVNEGSKRITPLEERETFEKETYVYDEAEFDSCARAEIGELIKKPSYKRDWVESRFKEQREIEAWAAKYSGKITKGWAPYQGRTQKDYMNEKDDVRNRVGLGEYIGHALGNWHNIYADVGNSDVQLTEEQINAAAEYPGPHVKEKLGQTRPLTREQLKLLAGSVILSRYTDIVDAQGKMGVAKEDIQVANWIFQERLEASELRRNS